jgi:tetratricopeptide (TPR) repeat protein
VKPGLLLLALPLLASSQTVRFDAPALAPNSPTIERLIDQGRHDEARRKMAELRVSEPESPRLALLEGMILFREGRPGDALRALQPSVDALTAPAASYKLAALCLVAVGKSREAAPFIREAIRRQPDDPMAHYYLGLHLLETRHYDESASAFLESIRLNPNYPDAHSMLGLVREEAGRYDEALVEYQEAVRLNVQLSLRRESPHIYLARHFHSRGRNREALESIEPALRLNPQSAEAWLLAGKIHLELEQADKAIFALEKAVAIAPRDKRIRYQKMRVYQKLGKFEEARVEREAYERMSETELTLWEDNVLRKSRPD